MKIEHFGGCVEVADQAALIEVLSARYGDLSNEYFLCGEQRYPMLSINVRGRLACVHFFPDENHPGFVSVGDAVAGNVQMFYTNTPLEEMEVSADTVVQFEQAREAACEFLRSSSIPTSLKWNEL